ncbi:zinc finger protein 34 [Drosophila mojavensis]|uniref:C2H2-type domain-containing protein n=1 Tax=Drosophila mojavensis TaxID=7230 RepID=B4KAQ7_DROMO|nr:zinc finger protein 34 [Drosophila mojavensis]EDW16794.1 uncharacterized protein Dmoj_GI10731 [Drosophila mojavensis]
MMIKSKKQGSRTIKKFSWKKDKPFRVRGVQTDPPSTSDIGIQCQRFDGDEDWFESVPSTESNENPDAESNFLAFVNQHTTRFPNAMLGCLLCGEVAKNLQTHQQHVRLHYGPPSLCSDCGEFVSHENLLAQHKYSCRAHAHPRSRPQMHMQCPHLHCSVMITSKTQLCQHLRKHLVSKPYYCLLCCQRFSSTTHFLVHRAQSTTCRWAKPYYLANNSTNLRHKAKINRCSVCLRLFSNAYRCLQHKRRCIQVYQRRLRQLLTNPKI